MKLTAHTFVSLDGVMQGPGGSDEDTTGGFERGGWLVPLADESFGAIVDGWFATAEALLLGRTTYEMMHPYWSAVTDPGNPIATAMNQLPKYVVSSRDGELDWANSTQLAGDPVKAVAQLKSRPGGELQIHGSHQLVRTLHDAGMIDEYRVLIFPVVVGKGKRLFDPGAVPSGFTVVSSSTTPSGLVSLYLRPAPFRTGYLGVEEGREVEP
ncbi:dihydrofolate reductase family protein [Arthrobacter sp. 35W]|uniref:dihydrofolate reductase family protein n=1 Tax=Arthrobacter sp. 35W TaxID=1132441 RepID=UPI000409A677|nr:dihydrofolate reductase family protein [Arthrobacter sp. 35W]